MKKHILNAPAVLLAGGLLTACGSDTPVQTPVAPPAISGVFLDSAVSGLEYVSGTAAKASTGVEGSFQCTTGDTVTFSLGGINLGAAPCSKTITPLSLSQVSQIKDDKVVNRLLALQILDEDQDPANGIH